MQRCCELLSILYLCSVKHNNFNRLVVVLLVVNCFQFCIFAVWNTTKVISGYFLLSLWIAFNFVSLQCETQRFSFTLFLIQSCELLSILYLCSVKHNLVQKMHAGSFVVNCFQFCIFAVWNTTSKKNNEKYVWLWIAFNFVSLQCETQLLFFTNQKVVCCELLSILYLCSVKHNEGRAGNKYNPVVNCFQFCIFAVWNTTSKNNNEKYVWLWIAFNFVSLQCETQQFDEVSDGNSRCELLSILYLCSVKHNFSIEDLFSEMVVNCFQFCIFAVWNTTLLW